MLRVVLLTLVFFTLAWSEEFPLLARFFGMLGLILLALYIWAEILKDKWGRGHDVD